MKRLLIDLTESQYARVADIARTERTTCEKVVIDAIQVYKPRPGAVAGTVDAFGLWGPQPLDSLSYVEKLRSEW